MIGNLFHNIPGDLPEEMSETLLQSPGLRIERIVSRQHATPDDQWYDQDWSEWAVLLQGSTGLRIEGRAEMLEMKPGDHVHLPAHVRHRVEWTDPDEDTIWLAIHYEE